MDDKMTNNRKKKRFLASVGMSALAGIMAVTGVVMAYLSKRVESRVKNFTFANNVSVKLEEPTWDEENSEPPVVVPGQTVSKDPIAENTGETPIYVFLEVKIPCSKVRTVTTEKRLDNDGEEKLTNLLSFTPNADWVKVSPEGDNPIYEPEQPDKAKYSVEVYAYLKELASGDKTTSLFNEVKYANVVEGEPNDKLKIDMPISVYAIQSECLEGVTEGTDIKAKLKKAYEHYCKS